MAGNKGRDAPESGLPCSLMRAAPLEWLSERNFTDICVSLPCGFPSVSSPIVLRCYTRVVGLHARTHGIRFAERHSRLNSKLKGAASGVNEHDIRRETPLLYTWRDYAALLAFERLTNRHIRRSLHRRYVDGAWIKQDMLPASKIVCTVRIRRNSENVIKEWY